MQHVVTVEFCDGEIEVHVCPSLYEATQVKNALYVLATMGNGDYAIRTLRVSSHFGSVVVD